MPRLLSLFALLASGLCASDWFLFRSDAPVYPILANQARIEGVVRLKLSLDEEGGVLKVDLISGHPVLARTAEENIRLWKFVAPCGDKQGASRVVEFTYEFRLNGEVEMNPRTQFRYEHPFRAIVTSQTLHWMPSQRTHKP